MTCAMPSAVGRALRRDALPLAWYYAVTLAIPLANGAAEAGRVFVWHALLVLVVPPFLIVVASGTRGMARAIQRGWLRRNPRAHPRWVEPVLASDTNAPEFRAQKESLAR